VNFGISATDPDGQIPTLTAEDVPANATFTDNGDGTGAFDFEPNYTQSGIYFVNFIASDGVLADTGSVEITVNEAGNQPPYFLDDPPDEVLTARKFFALRLEAEDLEGTPLILTAEDLPANSSFVDSGNGIGGFEFTPDVTQAGDIYTVTFIASDGIDADTVEVTYTIITYIVGDVNEDGLINPVDVVLLVNYVYLNGVPPEPVPEAGDINCDGSVNPVDVVLLVNYVYRALDPPPEYCP